METIESIFNGLWETWTEMFGILMELLPKLINLVLWALSAVIILPCVFVAGVLYPKWTEWGEHL
ncbi:MAG: hypothetical protein KGI45_03845 [Patescibacteria group bacterium]|nr:hypothetical protein [Patescibacteria group bacterium]